MEVALEAGTFATVGRGFKDWMSIADALGFRAMELWVDRRNLWPTTERKVLKEYAEELRSAGITVTSIVPTPFAAKGWREFEFQYNLADTSESARKRAVAFYKSIIALAVQFDAKNVLTLPGKIKESDLMKSKSSYRQHWEQIVKSLSECSKAAEDVGVCLGVENAVICNYIDLPEELADLVNEVSSDHVKVYLDIANANAFRDPLVYIRALRGLLCDTIHTTDNDGAHPLHLPIGMGTIDYRRVIGALREIGWDGYLLPELFYEKDPVEGLRQSKKKLESIIRSQTSAETP